MRRGADQSFEPLFDSGASKYVEVWGGGGVLKWSKCMLRFFTRAQHTHIYTCRDICVRTSFDIVHSFPQSLQMP